MGVFLFKERKFLNDETPLYLLESKLGEKN